MTLLRRTTLVTAGLLAASIAGCGSDARHVQEATGGTSAGGKPEASAGEPTETAGSKNYGGGGMVTGGTSSGGDGAHADTAGEGGEAGTTSEPGACVPECQDGLMCSEGRCVECTINSPPRCNENTPLACQDGAWVELPACSGATPACSNGSCSLAVLTGSFATVSAPLSAAGDIRLAEQGLEYLPSSCAQDQTICVTGGIYP